MNINTFHLRLWSILFEDDVLSAWEMNYCREKCAFNKYFRDYGMEDIIFNYANETHIGKLRLYQIENLYKTQDVSKLFT